jgi:hypothetical protein
MNIKEAQELIANQETFNSPAALTVSTKGMYATHRYIPIAVINTEIAVYNQRTYKMSFKNLNRFVAHELFIMVDGTTTISREPIEIAISKVYRSGTIAVQLSSKVGA